MNDSVRVKSFREKKEFLQTVLESEERRRSTIENKSSILIASNAILLSAMIGFIFPLKTTQNPILWLQIALSVIAFVSVIISTLICAQVLTPWFTQKQRGRLMDLGEDPETEYNLFLFTRITKYNKTDYQKEIEALTEREIINQLSSQVHNLSRILKPRYLGINRAYIIFMLSTISFALLSATKLFVYK